MLTLGRMSSRVVRPGSLGALRESRLFFDGVVTLGGILAGWQLIFFVLFVLCTLSTYFRFQRINYIVTNDVSCLNSHVCVPKKAFHFQRGTLECQQCEYF